MCVRSASRARAQSLLAVGFDNGAVMLQIGTALNAATLQYQHCGGTLCLTFSEGEEILLLSGGADGLLHFTQVGMSNHCELALQSTLGSTAGTKGVLVELIVADASHWAAPVGRFISVGKLPGFGGNSNPSEPAYLGPLTHVVDAVQLLPTPSELSKCIKSSGSGSKPAGGLLAAASFGGVSLWTLEPHTRAPTLPAARRGEDADLACDGWARSLLASPDGGWLASWVTVAGDAPTKLWLWRMADGADFECGGFGAPITALAWSEDSSALAACTGEEALVWSFCRQAKDAEDGPRGSASGTALRVGPGGQVPRRCKSGVRSRLVSAAFDSSGARLACGAADGTLLLFSTAGERHEVVRSWQPADTIAPCDPPIVAGSAEHLDLAWDDGGRVLVSATCGGTSVLSWDLAEEDAAARQEVERRERKSVGQAPKRVRAL